MYDNLDDVCQYLENMVNSQRTALGLKTVVFGADAPVPNTYPSVIIIPGVEDWHANSSQRGFRVDFTVMVYVLHADLTQSRAARTHSDLQLARSVRNLVHSDFTLGGNTAGGFVRRVSPARLPYPKAKWVLGTEMTFMFTSRIHI